VEEEKDCWMYGKDHKRKLSSNPEDTIFPRQYRWTIEGNMLDPYYVKSVEFDWVLRRINLQIYEVVLSDKTEPAMDWKNHIEGNTEQLTFTTYDGCGNTLYQHVFHEVHLGSMGKQKFDYSNEDVSVLTFQLQYKKCERIPAQEAQENSSENSSSK